MKNTLSILIAIAIFLPVTSCDDLLIFVPRKEGGTPPSVLVKAELLDARSYEDIQRAYADVDQEALTKAAAKIKDPTIEVYRLVYRTQNAFGEDTQASGIVIIPQGGTTDETHLIAYFHGTVEPEGDFGGNLYYPSVFNYEAEENFEPLIMSLFAMNGNIVIAPDYLGYGEAQDEFHPYNIYSALAPGNLDMIRASKEFLQGQHTAFKDELYLAGWSEGAAAGMAFQQYLQERHISDINSVAGSFMAGAYSNFDLATTVLQSDQEWLVMGIYGRTLLAYDSLYRLGQPNDYYFQEPFVSDFEEAFFPVSTLERTTNEFYTPTFRANFLAGTDPLVASLKTDDLTDWQPAVPVQLLAGEFDEWVPSAQTANAAQRLRARGADITSEIVPDAGHGFISYIPRTLDFFEQR